MNFDIKQIDPLGSYMLFKIKSERERRSEGGIILPGNAGKNYLEEVIAVGPDVKNVRVGDHAIWHQGAKFQHDGQDYSVAHENQVLVRVKGPAWKGDAAAPTTTETFPAPLQPGANFSCENGETTFGTDVPPPKEASAP